MRWICGLVAVGLMTAGLGCSTYKDGLSRGRTAYEASEHEKALSILRGLENDLDHLSNSERTQYFYLRGLTDYRIGYRSDARHWLALAQASDRQYPGSLPEAWKSRMEEALTALNGEVYAGGIEAMSNAKRAPAPAPPPAKSDEPSPFEPSPAPSTTAPPSPSP
jgi:hypothetical protein